MLTTTPCRVPHHIECSEIWGGNRGDALDVETDAVRASLFSKACGGCRGGDIYYFSVCSTGDLTRLALVDVLGHGEAVAETSQWLYQSLVTHMNSPDNTAVLEDLNHASVGKGLNAMSTAALASVFRSTQALCVAYAGHHELLLNRRDTRPWVPIVGRKPEEPLGDIPLGVDPRTQFGQRTINLSPGDRVLLYTDGVVEAPDIHDEPFGLDRLIDTLTGADRRPLPTIRSSVVNALLTHTEHTLTHDDVTFIALEVRDIDAACKSTESANTH